MAVGTQARQRHGGHLQQFAGVCGRSLQDRRSFFLWNLPAFAAGTAKAYPCPADAELADLLGNDLEEQAGRAEFGHDFPSHILSSRFDRAGNGANEVRARLAVAEVTQVRHRRRKRCHDERYQQTRL
ncbi:MAG: hypothetical protein ACYDES_04525 [Acidimicrobiales bacterium]